MVVAILTGVAVQHGDSQPDPPGVYADRGKVEGGCFFTKPHNLLCCGF